MWGIAHNSVADLTIKDELLSKCTEDQLFLKSDLERIIQMSKTITNDKVKQIIIS
jgi:hypothetical protein